MFSTLSIVAMYMVRIVHAERHATRKHEPEHFGISQTAIDVGVHRGSHIALLSSCSTFMASIHDPTVTSSLLNILKLKCFEKNESTKNNQVIQ